MLDYLAVHADTSGGLYLFGTHDAFLSNNGKGRVVSLDTANGNMLWQTDANTASTVQEVTFEDKLGYLYVSWRHATVGSTNYKCMTEKYNKQTGNQVWQNNFDFSLLPAPALPKGSSEAGMDILVDDVGDVYTTGYYAANNYGPGTWGIAKFNGVNGNNLFQTTVIKDSSDHDDASHGIGCVLINNRLYSVGNRQEFPNALYYAAANAQLVKLDKQNGAILHHQRLLDDYNFQSRTVGIERVGQTKTAVLKQVGLNGVLELYDFNENLLWSKTIRSYHLLNADLLAVFDDGSMVVAGHSSISRNTPPYYGNSSDTNHLFHYSNSGQLLHHWKVETPNRERVLQVLTNGSEVFAVIKTSNVQFGVHSIGVSKFGATGFIGMKNLGQVNTVDPTIQRVVQLGNTLGCFTLVGYATYLELDMASMTLSTGATINNCSSTYHIDRLKDPQQILLCTRNGSYDQLMAYDVSAHDTLWTEAYEDDSRIWKFVYDADTNFAYTMGYKGNQFNTLVIRKVRLSDGHQLWSNEYAAPTFSLLDALPYDIAWDANRHQVVVGGFKQDTTGFFIRHDVLVHTVDSSGNTVQTSTQRPFGTKENVANTVEILPNGSVWAGGNLHRDALNKEGFIYGLDTVNLYCGVTRSITTCGVYTSPYSARTYTESGVYLDTLVSTSGCDSLIELNLIIDSLNTAVTQTGITLSSAASNVSYQWLDCADGFKPVPGAVNSSFTPDVDGVYAVELRENSCIDTSACFTVQGVGLQEHYLPHLAVYPNPSEGTFSIQLPDHYSTVEVKLSDIQGKTVYSTRQKPEGTACTIRTSLAKGIYLSGVYHEGVLVGRFKVVLE